MSEWSKFYEGRCDFRYYVYARKRYAPMIEELFGASVYLEEGCGIGTISKILCHKYRCGQYTYKSAQFVVADKDPDMIMLAVKNLGPLVEGPRSPIEIYTHNIFGEPLFNPEVVFSHGVLEHFCDMQIKAILRKQQKIASKVVHYVPTDGYDKPSFGDERLLPYGYWLDNFKPTRYTRFNDNKDLLLIWE